MPDEYDEYDEGDEGRFEDDQWADDDPPDDTDDLDDVGPGHYEAPSDDDFEDGDE